MSDAWENYVKAWGTAAFGSEVASFDHDVVGGCGNGTCELTDAELRLTFADGRTATRRAMFGLYLRDAVPLELNSDGTLSKYADTGTWDPTTWEVTDV